MTRDEAIQAMRRGERVRHRHFGDEEWIEMVNCCTILTEEGYRFGLEDFMAGRDGEGFKEGWSIVKK